MTAVRFERYESLLRAPNPREGRDVGYVPLEGRELLDYQAANVASRAKLIQEGVIKIVLPQKPEASA
jgi:hypothetical protein